MTIGQAIEVPKSDECAFCSYLRGDRGYSIVSRTDLIATLVTREQRGHPHLLVIPIAHRETILDISDDEATAILVGVRDAARAIDQVFRRPGIAVWQNNGVPAFQSIGHVHFHVAGTLDEGGTDRGQVAELSLSQTDAIARQLRAALTIVDQS